MKKYSSIILIVFLASCGIWTDFTTFFNLYFNTRQLYYEVEEEINNLPKEPFQLKEPEINTTIKTKLITLQEKTSKILQHESESSYFDNALFISGWAFYYNGDFLKASRKFQELASLGTEEYDLVSKMWIGKCNLQMRNFEQGMKTLAQVRDSALAREDEDVLNDVYREIIAYHIDREEFEIAISQGKKFISISENDELSAKVAYQIGLLYLEQGNEQEAANSFESVLEYSPDFETEFQSKFELAKLKKELGFVDESQEMLDDLYNEGKYAPFWGDVYYEIGAIEYEAENYDKAFEIFTDINEFYSNSKGALLGQLMLGEIMRNVYADYDSAKFYYDKVRGNNVDPELVQKAEVYSQSITTYLNLKDDIYTSDRQITYLLEPTEFLRDSLAYERFLVQSGVIKPDEILGDTTQTDTSSIALSDTTNIADSTLAETQPDSVLATPKIDISSFNDDYLVEIKPEYPKIGIDSLEAKIAKDYFELGNLFFTDLLRPDSAYYYYTNLLSDFPDTKFKPRVFFALGTYFETKSDSVKSDSLYTIVYNEYKTHPIANEAAKKLGKPELLTETDPAKDEYLKAEKQLDSLSFSNALAILKDIALDYPESIYKPKSLYTIGWIYENQINEPDSAAAYYSQLVENYRNSEYASSVQRKVATYNAEIKKQEEEQQQTVEPEPSDSTIVENPDTLISPEELINPPANEPEPTDTTLTTKK